jgi:A/G-specific adenine glycosylase
MLQQTRVETVVPYYERFLARFPTVGALAAASLDDVLKMWENLGYYSRARHLHAAARTVVKEFGGVIPETAEELARLAGIGEYTVGAILSIAFDRPFAAVDGNVRRVLARVFAIAESVDEPPVRARIGEMASRLVPRQSPGDFNQALMELGATICTPRMPVCKGCPVQTVCRAYGLGLQNSLPLRRKRTPTRHETVTAAVIRNRRREILVVQRPREGLLGGLWKFPGGTCKEGESLPDAVQRTVREEVGISVRPGSLITSVDHAYTHFRITLHAFECVRVSGRPRKARCTDWRWARVDELEKLAFSKADREVVRALDRSKPS